MENSPPCDSLILCHRRMLPQLWPACRPFCVPDRSYRFPRDGSCRRIQLLRHRRSDRPARPHRRLRFRRRFHGSRLSWFPRLFGLHGRFGHGLLPGLVEHPPFPASQRPTGPRPVRWRPHTTPAHRTRPRPPPCISAPRALARGAACVGRRRARRSTRWTVPCPSDSPDTASCLPCNVRAGDSHRPPRISAHPCHEADARHAGWLARRPFTPRSRHHAFSDGSNGYPSS